MESDNGKIRTIADLTPDPDNARSHTARGVGMIEEALNEVGAARSIVIDEDGIILAGNATVEAAANAGIERVKVVDANGNELVAVRRSGLTGSAKKRLALYDNRTGELSDWSGETLAAMQREDEALLAGLFRDDELELILGDLLGEPTEDPGAQIDKAAELQEKWQVERGQVWEIGRHRLMCGDSTSAEDVGQLMDRERATMVFADPPYGMKLDTDYSSILGSRKAQAPTHIKGKTYAAVIGDDQEFDPTFLLMQFNDVKEIFLWGADYYAKLLPIGGWFVWDKCVTKDGIVSDGAERMIGSTFELCWSKQKHKRLIVRLFHRGFTSVDHSERVHPTQKPIQLAEWFVERFSNANDLIVDPFLGSGTTLVACEQTGRIGYGMEISEKYCSVTLERLTGMGLEARLV